jgi:hypothetical protein
VIQDRLWLHAGPQPEGIIVARIHRIRAGLCNSPWAQQRQQQRER